MAKILSSKVASLATAGLCAVSGSSLLLVPAVAAVQSASAQASYETAVPQGIPPQDHGKFTVTTPTIAASEVGKTLILTVTGKRGVATVDENSLSLLSSTVSGKWTPVSGGSGPLVTGATVGLKVPLTASMVGHQVELSGRLAPLPTSASSVTLPTAITVGSNSWHPSLSLSLPRATGGKGLGTKDSCRLNDGGACPASWFQGPLGDHELIPSGVGGFLIDQYGGQNVSWEEKQAGIEAREKALGRKFDSIQLRVNADPTSDNSGQEKWIVDSGHPFVTVAWDPTYDLASINNGSQDALLRKAADYWKTIKAPVMLRMLTEFNLNSTVLDNKGCGSTFQEAWQHIVTVFKEEGASNVGFWYNPDEGNHRDCIIDSYPGDKYVDWVGSDSYNWCPVGSPGCWSTPKHAGAATFGELFNYSGTCPNQTGTCPASQVSLFGPRKPFVVGETGSISDSTAAEFKPTFMTSIATDAPSMPYLKGVSLYDCDVTPVEGPNTNFRIDYPVGNTAVAQADKTLAASKFFNTTK